MIKFIRDWIIVSLGGMTREDHEYAMERQRARIRSRVRAAQRYAEFSLLAPEVRAEFIADWVIKYIDYGAK